jgi:protein-tyrosine-phosphatase
VYNACMKIHFVCSGNTYRSRLAEAYLNSLKPRGIVAVSSGTHAKIQPMEIRWYTERILEEYGLSPFASKLHRQTTSSNLKDCDLIVFFGPSVYSFCKKSFAIKKPHIVWKVKDVRSKYTDSKLVKLTEGSFREIKKKIKELISTYDHKARNAS